MTSQNETNPTRLREPAHWPRAAMAAGCEIAGVLLDGCDVGARQPGARREVPVMVCPIGIPMKIFCESKCSRIPYIEAQALARGLDLGRCQARALRP